MLRAVLEFVGELVIETVTEVVGDTLTELGGHLFRRNQRGRRKAHQEATGNPTVYLASEVDEAAEILALPRPVLKAGHYLPDGPGVVRVRLILASDGWPKNIKLLSDADDVRRRSALRAARGIRFRPAIRQGQSVSQWFEHDFRFDSA